MRATKIMLALLAIGGSLSVSAQGAADLAQSLINLPAYSSNARFEVLIPSAEDPVVYEIALQSKATEGTDSLAPCDYIIDWSTDTSHGAMSGFSAYFSGNHYRYRNNRLQEYHTDADIIPFEPHGPGSSRQGVQSTAQFADLIPQFLGQKFMDMIADSSYIYKYHPDTLVNGRRSVVIDGVKRGAGYDTIIYTYVLDYDTHLPVMTEIETSPATISEQIMNIYYTDPTAEPIEINEEGLLARWPEVFEKYRQSTFKAENLAGTRLPAFSCQVLDSSDRYTHHSDENLAKPLIIVFLDPDVATTANTIADIRQAVDMAPADVDVIWAFNSNRTQEIKQAVGKLRPGETALTSASQLVRNCGITLYPTTIIVGSDAKVTDVVPGYNNDLGLIVLQKTALVK